MIKIFSLLLAELEARHLAGGKFADDLIDPNEHILVFGVGDEGLLDRFKKVFKLRKCDRLQ